MEKNSKPVGDALITPFDVEKVNRCVVVVIDRARQPGFPGNVLDVHCTNAIGTLAVMIDSLRHNDVLPPVVGKCAEPGGEPPRCAGATTKAVEELDKDELLDELEVAFKGPREYAVYGDQNIAALSGWQLFLLARAIRVFGPMILKKFGFDEAMVDQILDTIDSLL